MNWLLHFDVKHGAKTNEYELEDTDCLLAILPITFTISVC